VPSSRPQITVVIATRNRPDRLAAALTSLRAQTLDQSAFDVIVVDDDSTDSRVPQLLADAEAGAAPRVSVIRRSVATGPSRARNEGWRAATGELIAFTDDDCELTPEWLAAGLTEWDGTSRSFVQGRTSPLPAERDRLGMFAYTIDIPEMSSEFQTCNIFYPRALLEELGGFDAETHPTSGEDTDLAWRAIEAGATARFAPRAQAYHAVVQLTPSQLVKRAWNFSDAIIPFGAHPQLRRQRLIKGLFWNWSHYLLLRGLIALLLPRRLWPLSVWLAVPLIRFQVQRARSKGGGPQHVPWLLLYDSVELAAVLRGAARGRTIVI
jgi:glycosyltransferase involved in cell wall biosynthesis